MAYEDFVGMEVTLGGGNAFELKGDGRIVVTKTVDPQGLPVGTSFLPGQEVQQNRGDVYSDIRDAIASIHPDLPANTLPGNATYKVGHGGYSYIGNSDGTIKVTSAHSSGAHLVGKTLKEGDPELNPIADMHFGGTAGLKAQTQPTVTRGDVQQALGDDGAEETAEGGTKPIISQRERALLKLFRQAKRGEATDVAARVLRGAAIGAGVPVEAQKEIDETEKKRGYIDAIVDLQGKLQDLSVAEGKEAATLQKDVLKTLATVVNARMGAQAGIKSSVVKTYSTEIARLNKERENIEAEFALTASKDEGLVGKYGTTVRSQIRAATTRGGKLDVNKTTILLDNLSVLLRDRSPADKIRIINEFAIDSGEPIDVFLKRYVGTSGAQSELVTNIMGDVMSADAEMQEQSRRLRTLREAGVDLADDIAKQGVGEANQLMALYVKFLGTRPGSKGPVIEGDELGTVSDSITEQIEAFNKALEQDPTGVSSARIQSEIMKTKEFQAFGAEMIKEGRDKDEVFSEYRGRVRRLGRAQEKGLRRSKAEQKAGEREELAAAGFDASPRTEALQRFFRPKLAKPVATAKGVEKIADTDLADPTTPAVPVALPESLPDVPLDGEDEDATTKARKGIGQRVVQNLLAKLRPGKNPEQPAT